jgi:hypothetical protein
MLIKYLGFTKSSVQRREIFSVYLRYLFSRKPGLGNASEHAMANSEQAKSDGSIGIDPEAVIRMDAILRPVAVNTAVRTAKGKRKLSRKYLISSGERGRNRTYNLVIKSHLLCQLSYAP